MLKYCPSTSQTKRWKTREVLVGKVGIGSDHPIRIQSMTTSNTRDVEATVEQVIRLSDAGCEIVRLTVQGMKEAFSCELIKNSLLQKGYSIPIVADIHFYPPAAMQVIEFVDKVRINPGNYVDKRASFKVLSYDDISYGQELEKIEEKFTPLVEKCKHLKKAMRIGTNHGSLSDRIMNRYGDTPEGMVESALEFARICRKNNYHNFLFSMKSSNPKVMILAYRLLVAKMMELGWDYPLHLGVTEAGEGEDGRIKSAMGIGSLLVDGLGDTIRVSLTEDPWQEIDPCKRLVHLAKTYEKTSIEPFTENYRDITSLEDRPVVFPKNIGLHKKGSVFLSLNPEDIENKDLYEKLGYKKELDQPKPTTSSVDALFLKEKVEKLPLTLEKLQEMGMTLFSSYPSKQTLSLLPLQEIEKINPQTLFTPFAIEISEESKEKWSEIEKFSPSFLILSPKKNPVHFCRKFFDWLQENKILTPVILRFSYTCSKEDLIVQASTEFGSLLCDGLASGIWVEANHPTEFLRTLSFNILQAARRRTSKTEFISCPSCGRTLFDLQEVSKRIRAQTNHLPEVKIAIMGCIVNGPGEMADADFGYVGSRPGMIDLYVGKNCVEKNIPFDQADSRLIELIKKEGQWIEPTPSEEALTK